MSPRRVQLNLTEPLEKVGPLGPERTLLGQSPEETNMGQRPEEAGLGQRPEGSEGTLPRQRPEETNPRQRAEETLLRQRPEAGQTPEGTFIAKDPAEVLHSLELPEPLAPSPTLTPIRDRSNMNLVLTNTTVMLT